MFTYGKNQFRNGLLHMVRIEYFSVKKLHTSALKRNKTSIFLLFHMHVRKHLDCTYVFIYNLHCRCNANDMKGILFVDILKSRCKANGKTKSQASHISSEKVNRGGSSLVLAKAQLPHNLFSALRNT